MQRGWIAGVVLALVLGMGAPAAHALVDIEKWQRPPAVTMIPRVENLRLNPMIFDAAEVDRPAGEELDVSHPLLLEGGLIAILPWTESFVAGIMAEYQNDRVEFEPGEEVRLTMIMARLAAGFIIDERNMLMIQPGAGIYTDMDGVDRRDVGQSHVAFWHHVIEPDRFSIVFGLAVVDDFNTNMVVPLFGGTWMPTDTIRIDGLLPSYATATWHMFPWLYLVYRFNVYSNVFNVNEPVPFGEAAARGVVGYDMRLQEVVNTAGIGWQINRAFFLEAMAGGSLGRSIEIHPRGGEGYLLKDVEPAPVFRALLGARF